MKRVLAVASGMAACLMLVPDPAQAQQVLDTEFRPPIASPTYPLGTGPIVLIDEAHSNFHTATGLYRPFAELLRRDGYVVRGSAEPFTLQALRAAKVLVIANALNARQSEPGAPSEPWPAFTPEEIVAVREWVAAGGSLLLIVDRRPFAGAAADLGLAFGVRLRNDWALDPRDRDNPLVFRRTDGTLVDHAITRGIDEVATFQGSSFTLEEGGQPLLVFGPSVYSVTLINRPDPNPLPLRGSLQGAAVSFAKGRLGVFGEAAMFSAQLTGPEKRPMGMNAPIARQNALLLLNLMRWLAGAV